MILLILKNNYCVKLSEEHCPLHNYYVTLKIIILEYCCRRQETIFETVYINLNNRALFHGLSYFLFPAICCLSFSIACMVSICCRFLWPPSTSSDPMHMYQCDKLQTACFMYFVMTLSVCNVGNLAKINYRCLLLLQRMYTGRKSLAPPMFMCGRQGGRLWPYDSTHT